MSLDARTERNLKKVHPDLVKVFREAYRLTDTKPIVTCGARSVEEQRILVAKGASKTMNSRHIPGKDGTSKALDVAFIINGKLRWDWPLFATFAKVMKQAAKSLGVSVEWGGDWKSFKDGPHFQLPYRTYP
jgi:peptidoglycan L-alanyl-D-glutamate endopeptidase CwlK